MLVLFYFLLIKIKNKMAKSLSAIEIEKATELIRQQRETFNQRKQQDSQWFVLKLVMGFSSIFLLAIVLIFSIYILINHGVFPEQVVASACVALLIDILGLIASVWKIVLNSNPITKLEPIITTDE